MLSYVPCPVNMENCHSNHHQKPETKHCQRPLCDIDVIKTLHVGSSELPHVGGPVGYVVISKQSPSRLSERHGFQDLGIKIYR